MDGIICINKPQEHTSFDVIARMRGIVKVKKIGHSGTLDPMATGVLPVFIGKATKAISLMEDDDKIYKAGFKLGKKSNTYDIWGEIQDIGYNKISKSEVESALKKYTGDIKQMPPMFSAVKINGQRLYDIAREGREVERPLRDVTVYKITVLSFDEEKGEGEIEIFCSKGTYIRSIINDFGNDLSGGAIMTSLVRTRACGFSLEDCITIDEAGEYAKNETIENYLKPIESVFENLPKIVLSDKQSVMYKNGVKLDLRRVQYKNKKGYHMVYNQNNEFLGISSLDFEKMELKLEKMF